MAQQPEEVEGFEVPIRRALTEKLFWCSVPRELFLLNALSAAFIIMILHFMYYIPIPIIVHFIFVYLAKKDPFIFDIFLRYQETQKQYWS